jgi:hypothetical protein
VIADLQHHWMQSFEDTSDAASVVQGDDDQRARSKPSTASQFPGMTLLPLMCWAGCARLDPVRPADAQPTLTDDVMINNRTDVRFASGRISRLGIMMFPVGTVRVAFIEKCAFCASWGSRRSRPLVPMNAPLSNTSSVIEAGRSGGGGGPGNSTRWSWFGRLHVARVGANGAGRQVPAPALEVLN